MLREVASSNAYIAGIRGSFLFEISDQFGVSKVEHAGLSSSLYGPIPSPSLSEKSNMSIPS